ncbi:facilitated trehalose transporter Tret1-like [Athalia rosae]|uniref:facilitated trehalose transporter Tret1-like n=1 Tax=Athalia rosae TaxID=37344 RepID=UPI0020335CA8|nr:facilitated trehalose transporter Tret1-like [Athalia rosae]XP_048507437.1 facilitated trehalose transporter Tret1-like [Athalia rosae]XP_048507439.1 facilitated trehalose transporter Tret1-like [Athalia rosae]
MGKCNFRVWSVFRNQVIATVTATLSVLAGGIHTGWTSPSLPKLLADDSDLPVTSDQCSWIASINAVSNIPGAFFAGAIVNRWGRKFALLLTAFPCIAAWVLIMSAQNYLWLYVARMLSGIGNGMTGTILPMYLGEIAQDDVRGAFGLMNHSMMSLGMLISYSTGPWVSRAHLAVVGIVMSSIFVLTFFWMPETPHFLVTKEPEDARKSLEWLRGNSDVAEEVKNIKITVEFDREIACTTTSDILSEPGNRKALSIATVLMIGQQVSGIGAVNSYSGIILSKTGSTLDVGFLIIIIGLVQLMGGLLSMFTVDHAGRRPVLLFSVFGSIVFLVGEALYFQLEASGIDVRSLSWLPSTSMVGYMVSYSIGLGSLASVVISEIFSYNIKAIASIWAMAVSSVSAMTVTKLYQVIADAYGIHTAFWGFALATLFTGSFLYFFLPETKQRSLGEIQAELRGTKKTDTVADNP